MMAGPRIFEVTYFERRKWLCSVLMVSGIVCATELPFEWLRLLSALALELFTVFAVRPIRVHLP